MEPPVAGKVTLFFTVIVVVVAIDYFTKALVQNTMHLFQQIDVIGDYVRLTYIYNPGAAFGIEVGPHSRLIFVVLTALALFALGVMYLRTPAREHSRLMSIALICAGAIGNLIDRLRSERGVIDFIDIGVGDVRWPVFNIADIAVTTGAVILAVSLWNEDAEQQGSP
jgi:signal peptidase II